MFSAATHRLITIPLAKYLDARLFGTPICSPWVALSDSAQLSITDWLPKHAFLVHFMTQSLPTSD